MSNEGKLWKYFLNVLGNEKAVAGLLGNIKAESNCNPENLQNTYEMKLGYTDATYTLDVDSGVYPANRFINDGAGYGLCQWTFWSRKKALLEYATACKVSIGSLFMQADFCLKELKEYGLFDKLCECKTIREASDLILTKYEMPADQSEDVKKLRCGYAHDIYKRNHKPVECNDVTISIQKIENELENLKKLLNLE